jgi:hypothetical protein
MITSSCPPGQGSFAEAREQVNVHRIPPAWTSGESHVLPFKPSLQASVAIGVDTGLHVSIAPAGLAIRNTTAATPQAKICLAVLHILTSSLVVIGYWQCDAPVSMVG